VISIFEEAYSDCIALFVFNYSSAYISLTLDALHAFDMNKSNRGKQRKQRDTVIPMNNLYSEFHGKLQKMTTERGKAKGLQQTLEECGFNVSNLKMKCSPVCAVKNESCCIAQLLSKQDNFWLQKSLLEEKITECRHFCVFLPKFHCKLNPIEMVCFILFYFYLVDKSHSIGARANTSIDKFTRIALRKQRRPHVNALMYVQSILSGNFSTAPSSLY
jgi:hypothetical protein